MNYILTPHKGIGKICLYSHYEDILQILDSENIKYKIIVQDNSECTVGYTWKIIIIHDSIKLFFSEGNSKLFKISIEKNSKIKLPNGIYVGMKIEEALICDPKLKYNEWDEIYESNDDYYLEDSLLSGKVVSLNIYVKELNDDNFDECNW